MDFSYLFIFFPYKKTRIAILVKRAIINIKYDKRKQFAEMEITLKLGTREYLDLFLTFFRIGTFTFGGGYAMIPLIEKEVVTKRKWIHAEEVFDIFAIAQSIPGAIAINSSTFIGYKIAGKKGAIIATTGVILPSLLIITIIAAFFTKIQDNPMVQDAFLGIRSCIVALILVAGIKICKNSIKDTFTVLITIVAFIATIFFDVPAILLIISSGILGLLLYSFKNNSIKKNKCSTTEKIEHKNPETQEDNPNDLD